MMRVALPLFGEDISPRFCFAREMIVIERHGQQEVSRRRVQLNDASWPERFSVLEEHRIDVLLCGGFPRRYLPYASRAGVRVIVGLAGRVEQVAEAFFAGRIEDWIVGPCHGQREQEDMDHNDTDVVARKENMIEKQVVMVAVDGQGGLDAMVSAHFGHCAGFVLAEVERGVIRASREVQNPHAQNHQPGMLPRFVQELGANVLLAGGMGQKAQTMLTRSGIEVATGATGRARHAIEAFLRGDLRGFAPCGEHDHRASCGHHKD